MNKDRRNELRDWAECNPGRYNSDTILELIEDLEKAEAIKSLNAFQEEVSEWVKQAFPQATFYSHCKHLQEELTELSYEIEVGCYNEADEEAADVLIMLVQYATFRGKSLMDLAERKMQINQNRQWETPDSDGVVRHKP